MGAYETVIGLECHVELSTATKMFCGCRNAFGAEPNTNVCPICLGHPGTLPVPNEKAIEYIVRIGLALDCDIAPYSEFSRKNYFYPDMPKDFQISQYDLPVCVGGHLDIQVGGEDRRIGITRVHMEEDTGKTTHAGETGRIHDADYALIDFNRAGVPLVECVSEPDLRSPEEAGEYLRALRQTLQALGVSDVRMEEGSLRCDGNISLRAPGSAEFGTKVEIKNMNSVRSLERALRHEQERQAAALEGGETLIQETRHWSEDEGRTISMRSKEEAFDYRYFPEPDLPPLEPAGGWVEEVRATLPELPAARRERYESELGLRPEQARILAGDGVWATFFEETVALGADAAAVANWLTQDLAGQLNEVRVELADAPVTPTHIADLIARIEDGTLSGPQAKQALTSILKATQRVEVPRIDATTKVFPPSIDEVIEREGLRQVSDAGALGTIVDQVIVDNPGPVEQFRGGKEGVIGFLVGAVMKASGGSANPKLVQELLRERLSG
ncbi:MAG: Asp-tRNA(Asn)/Glu-tRNA(Gln) amidotransferase subunit GatB [Actinomycetota bacterium]